MTTKRRYTYEHAPTLSKFAKSNALVRGLMGPFGSGKSSGCVAEIIRRAQAMPKSPDGKRRSRVAVVRNTYRQLEDSTIDTVFHWLPPRHYGTYRVADNTFMVDKLHPEIELEIRFRAMDRPDQVANLLSTEYTFAWLNEAREIPVEIVDGMTGRIGRFPPRAEVGDYWYGLWADTNPPDTDSWWYRRFEEQRTEGWEIFKQPGGLSDKAENLPYLPSSYYKNLAKGKTKDWVKVYVDGEYGFADLGRPIYPEYSDNTHVGDALEPSEMHPIWVGVDFGLTPAAVIGQRTAQRWVILHELVTDNMGAERFAVELNRLLAEHYAGFPVEAWGDPAGEQRSQVDERTPFLMLRKAGIPISPAPTNDFTLRRTAVATRLSQLAFDGMPQLLIHPRCTRLRKGMAGGYKYRRLMVAGEARYHDKPDKGPLSHVCEALQYLLAGAGEAYEVIRQPERPVPQEDEDISPFLHAQGWMAL